MTLETLRRFVRAAFFNVGDVIGYGKYKNKKGRIVGFSMNSKGQPVVEIEPIPKGRKQNKLIGLFKIWNLAAVEQAQQKESQMESISQRVAKRFVEAGLDVGRSWEIENLRIHRYTNSFHVTDLTNAGKRGKKVRFMAIGPKTGSMSAANAWMDRNSNIITEYTDFDSVKAFYQDLLRDYPNSIFIDEREYRGIDVNPGGLSPIRLRSKVPGKPKDEISIDAQPLEFHLTHKAWMLKPNGDGGFYQDTLYGSRKKDGAGRFYNWLKANMAVASKLDMEGFKKLWDDLDVVYDGH